MKRPILVHFFMALLSASVQAQLPQGFEAAKVVLREQIYHDQSRVGDFYCGCQWVWVGRSGGRLFAESCGFKMRAQANRAERLEWEHVVPAHNFGMARRCWQEGGSSNCQKTDPVFNLMEADLHNLVPAVGEINADRSNFRFGMLPGVDFKHGSCDFRVDFKARVAEPRDQVKGQVARIYLYMHQRYNLPMSDGQKRLFNAWNKQFPVTEWELERDRRIKAIVGHSNPFVSPQSSARDRPTNTD